MTATFNNLQFCRSFIRSNFMDPRPDDDRRRVALAMSRRPYSGCHDIAAELLKLIRHDPRLGKEDWAFFDRDLVSKILEDNDIPKEVAKYMPEDRDRDFKGVLNELLGMHPPLWDLFQHTCTTVRKLAEVGNVILIGRGAHIITREIPHVLHVGVIAPFEMRVQRAAQHLGLTEEAAARELNRQDKARKAYVSSHFDEDVTDPLAYHMVINTGKTPVPMAARLLLTALHRL